MSRATLGTRVQHLARAFAPHGFVPDRTWSVIRHGAHLSQILELQPGDSWLKDKFTCNVAWRFTLDGEPPAGFSYCAGIGAFLGSVEEVWYAHEPRAALDADYAKLTTLLRSEVLPFLDAVLALPALVACYEAAVAVGDTPERPGLQPRHFFGSTPGWAHYHLGWAYRTLEDSAKARAHFAAVTHHYSAEPYAWVQARKARCLEALTAL